MTRTYTQKDGTIWEWQETPEVLNAIKQYYDTVNEHLRNQSVSR